MNFAVLEPTAKVFSTKFGHAIPTMRGLSIPRKFSTQNGPTYRSVKVFSLESFLLYGMAKYEPIILVLQKIITIVETVTCIG